MNGILIALGVALFFTVLALALIGFIWVVRQLWHALTGSARPAAGVPQMTQGRRLQITREEVVRLHQTGRLDQASYQTIIKAIAVEASGDELTAMAPPRFVAAPAPAPSDAVALAAGAAEETTFAAIAHTAASADGDAPGIDELQAAAPAPDDRPAAVATVATVALKPFAAADHDEAQPVASVRHVEPAPAADHLPPGRWFSVFMEESNIRWGELIGGMLMVLCSVMLVMTFWRQITELPLLRFSLFTLATAAIYGLGFYSGKHWKVPTTSRALLSIGLLLTPLNLLAITAFAQANTGESLAVTCLGQGLALVIFAALAYPACQLLLPALPPVLPLLAIFLPALAQLAQVLPGHLLAPPFPLLMGLALAAQWAVIMQRALQTAEPLNAISEDRAQQLLWLLGLGGYCLIYPLGLLVFRSPDTLHALHSLAPAVSFCAVPLLLIGLPLGQAAVLRGTRLGLTATALTFAAPLVMVLALALAWPSATMLLVVSLISSALLISLAVRRDQPLALTPGLVMATLVLLLLDLLLRGSPTGGVMTLNSSAAVDVSAVGLFALSSAWALCAWSSVLALISFWIWRFVNHRWGLPLALAAAITGGAAVLLALTLMLRGTAAPADIWPILAVIGGLTLLATLLMDHAALSIVAAALTLLAAFLGLRGQNLQWEQLQQIAQFHAGALLLITLLARLSRRQARAPSSQTDDDPALVKLPLGQKILLGTSLCQHLLALVLLLPALDVADPPVLAAAGLFGQFLALALLLPWPSLAAALQIALVFPTFWALLLVLQRGAYLPGKLSSLQALELPRTWQALAALLLVLNLLWTALLRVLTPKPAAAADDPPVQRSPLASLFPSATWRFDELAVWASWLILAVISCRALWPGVMGELATTAEAQWAFPTVELSWVTWSLLGLLAWSALLRLGLRFRSSLVIQLQLTLFLVCPLLAGYAYGSFASASALRFLLAFFLLGHFLVLRLMGPAARLLPAPLLCPPEERPALTRDANIVALIMTLPLLLYLSALPLLSALLGSRILGPTVTSLFVRVGPLTNYGTPLLLASIALLGLAHFRRHRLYFYLAMLPPQLFAVLWWGLSLRAPQGANDLEQVAALFRLLYVNVACAGGFALLTLLLERWWRVDEHSSGPPLHRPVGLVTGLAMLLATAICFFMTGNLDGAVLPLSLRWPIAGLLSTIVLLHLSWLYDLHNKLGPRLLYPLALSAPLLLLGPFVPTFRQWIIALALLFPLFALASAWLWRSRRLTLAWSWRLLPSPRRRQIEQEEPALGASAPPPMLLIGGTFLLILLSLLLALAVDWLNLQPFPRGFAALLPPLIIRLLCASAALLGAFALPALTRKDEPSPLRLFTLLALGAAGVVWGWAWMSPHLEHQALNRLAWAASALLILLAALLPLSRRLGALWLDAANEAARLLGTGAGVMLGCILIIEAMTLIGGDELSISTPALIAVAIALLGMAVAALLAAILPLPATQQLTVPQRKNCVYLCEVMLGLLFLHLRAGMPFLFTGLIAQYWTLVTLALAFGGVGVGEFLQRRQQPVVGEPLSNSGALLPAIALIGGLFHAGRVDYAWVLVLASGLYFVLAHRRQSLPLALLAIFLGNGAYWNLLERLPSLGPLDHPQLYIIPTALCVLGAGYVHRQQLSDRQHAALRYLCLLAVYLSSTSEIFFHGVASSFYLPLILCVLAVAGVFAGMLLRVRAYLYAGTLFLLIALLSMIRCVQVRMDWTWLWWVAGFVLGGLIIAFFGLFERKKTQMLAVLEEVKEWRP